MEDFNRVINPGTVPHWDDEKKDVKVYVKIEYKEGRLSLSGVEGPLSNGDSVGSCGQIIDTLARKDFTPTPGGFWFLHVKRLHDVWKRWHLNDMRPECEHQRRLGWYDKAGIKVTLYHWRLDEEAQKEKDAAEEAAKSALLSGVAFIPSAAQTSAALRPYEVTTTTPEAPAHYGPRTSLYPGMAPEKEEKALGWLYPGEHPDGLLCRPCPECGYKYGSEWKREEVPDSVLRFLHELPEVERAPAWV